MAEIRSDTKIPAGLYVVATPIGNLSDITRRAQDTLKAADVIVCEDTRVTGKLLNAYLIKKRMMTYHEHNGELQRPKLLALLAEGKSIALVTDAGTPLISDPGYKLVEEAQVAGHRVTPIPGVSAVTAALSVAGLPTNRFLFMGFAPTKTKARQDWFTDVKDLNTSLVYYESAKRIAPSLKDAASVLGGREAAVCRELTKKFEEVVRNDLINLANHYAEAPTPKGEIVVVIGPPEKEIVVSGESISLDSETLLKAALEHMSVKNAAAFVADLTGEKKKELYSQALELSGK